MEPAELRKLVADMVAIPSANPLDGPLGEDRGEQALAAFVQSTLQAAGLRADLLEAVPGRPSVVARVVGERADEAILFDAHLDTVSGAGMEAPYTPRVEGDMLYGRGAADDKGSLAAAMAALMELARSGTRPPLTVYFTATADEEYQMRGLRGLLERGLKARGAVVGEPTGLEMVVAHKGVARFSVTTTGKSVHSSRPDLGVNAIYRMGHVLQALEHFAKGGVGRESHPLLGKATLSVGVIRGGEYVNVVPDRCTIEVDRRLLPGEEARKAVNEVRNYLASALDAEIDLSVSSPSIVVPGLNMSADDPWVKGVGAAIRAVTGKLSLEGDQATTHAGLLANADIPAVVVGPGSMGLAHTAMEALDLNQLEQAAAIFLSLMQTGAGL
jgi:acetylornithine deacetylase/succinyl-diaminopimelate desuccinylase family protein